MTFEQNNNDLLKFMLNERFFNPWKEFFNAIQDGTAENVFDDSNTNLYNETNMELYITTNCNQSCKYCYLVTHGKELYPEECNDQKTIIHNLEILVDWIQNNDFFLNQISCFSGEIWHTNFGIQILDLLYDASIKKKYCREILIPSNCSFVSDPRQLQIIQNYIDDFQALGIRLVFSISIDGKIIEDMTRPRNDKNKKDDEFYELIFAFAAHNTYLFHPMVSAISIEYWIDNWKWWVSQLEKHDFWVDKPFDAIMLLEVRNHDEWTEDKIQKYLEFIDYLENYYSEFFNNDKLAMYKACLFGQTNSLVNLPVTAYMPFLFGENKNYPACSIATTMTVRLGDLAIVPCHRTSYNKYMYGRFIIEDNKIIDIKAYNIQAANRILFMNNNYASFGCDTCPYTEVCIHQCFGNQIETNDDPFLPDLTVCNFLRQKYKHILQNYESAGFIDYLKSITPYNPDYKHAIRILNLYKEVMT